MIVRELVTLLGFQVNKAAARDYEKTVESTVSNVQSRINQMRNILAGAFAGLGALAGVREIARAGDEMVGIMARLKFAVGGNITEAERLYELLHTGAVAAGTATKDTVAAFAGFRNAIPAARATNDAVLEIVTGLLEAGVVAGASGEQISGVATQLTQGFSRGKMELEEVKILFEQMAPFAQQFARALYPGKDQESAIAQMMEDAGKGKITLDRMVPALRAAGKAMHTAFLEMPGTMDRGQAGMVTAFRQVLADLDEVLGLSRRAAAGFRWVRDLLVGLRDVNGEFQVTIRRLGGIEAITRLVQSALMVAFGGAVLGTVVMMGTGLAGIAASLALILLRVGLVAAGFLSWVIILDDIRVWMSGGDSLIGDKLGPFEEFLPKLQAGLKDFSDAWLLVKGAVSALGGDTDAFSKSMGDLTTNIPVWIAAIGTLAAAWWGVRAAAAAAGAVGLLGRRGRTPGGKPGGAPDGPPVSASDVGLAGLIARRLGPAALLGLTGMAGTTDDRFNEQFLRNREAAMATQSTPQQNWFQRNFGSTLERYGWQFRRDGEHNPQSVDALMLESFRKSMPSLPAVESLRNQLLPMATGFGSLAAPGSMAPHNTTLTQTNTVTIPISVVATGVSPTDIAGAAERGVRGAGDAFRNNADSWGRDLLMANPPSEARAQ